MKDKKLPLTLRTLLKYQKDIVNSVYLYNFVTLKTIAEIQGLSAKRLEEAKLLLSNGYFEGAFYLAGYSVELMLKARICKHLNIEDFYLRQPEPLKKAYFVHNLEQLLTLSGLRRKYEDKTDPLKGSNKVLNKNWNKICSWNESARYDCLFNKKIQ